MSPTGNLGALAWGAALLATGLAPGPAFASGSRAHSPDEVDAARRLVWETARSGDDARAAALLRARPWLYRTDPGATHPRAGGDSRPAVDRLVRAAAAETRHLAGRCAVCHYREPPAAGPELARTLFPDRDLLGRALAVHARVAARSPSVVDARRTGELYLALANLFPPRHAEARNSMGRARQWLERGVKALPRDTRAWNQLGLVRMKLGDGPGAERAWRRSVVLAPRQEQPWVSLLALAQARGDSASVEQVYREARARAPRSAALLTNYGVYLWHTGRAREAAAAHRQALQVTPGDPAVLLNLGLALKATGDVPAAEAAIRESIRLRPSSGPARNALGSVFASRGDWERAASAFAEAARLSPDLAAAHANLGRAYEHLGHTTEAANAYRTALLWQPERVDLRQRLDHLNGAR